MIDYQRQFHIGVRVPDLGVAMAELGTQLGLQWAKPQELNQRVWSPTSGDMTVALRYTYSMQGPQHLELLEGPPGSIWHGEDRTGAHHLGIWVDDVVAETSRLIAAGWTLELAQRPPEKGFGAFSYVRSPDGVLIEPVLAAMQPMFERWWAGGELR